MQRGAGSSARALPVLPPLAGLAALVLVVLLLAGGCTPVATEPTPGGPVATRPAVGARATTTPTAELRAGVTALLLQRAHLLALARSGAPATGPLDLLTAELVDVAGGPPDLAGALLAEQRLVLEASARPAGTAGAGGPAARATVAAATVPDVSPAGLEGALTRGLPQPVAAALAALDVRAVEGQAALQPAEALTAGRLLATEIALQRGLPAPTTAAASLRSRLTALLLHRTALLDSPERASLDRVLAAAVVQEPGPVRQAVAAALAAQTAARDGNDEVTARADAALAAALARALPGLSAEVLLGDLTAGRQARTAYARAPAGGRALALRGATDAALRPAAALAAAAAERAALT